MPDYSQEEAFLSDLGRADACIVGLDEVGRGPWAGPVVAAAVWLNPDRLPKTLTMRLDDSKKLSLKAREAVSDTLWELNGQGPVHIGLGQASVEEIDKLNILQASMLAMQRAASALPIKAAGFLVDGNRLPLLPGPARSIVKGDSVSLSIAAASVVAKVNRDDQMKQLSLRYPGYGWERNQGYGTAEHKAALLDLGVTPAHRRTFRPVQERLQLTN